MRDGMEKGAPVINRKQYMLICALAGLLILSGVLIFSTYSDLQNAEKQFEDTISYVKEQCTGYDNLNLASETKSLMRMMENVQHLCSEIARDQKDNPGRVLDDAAIARLQNDLPDDEILYDLAELFRVFGDSTRIKILYALFESELCVNDIAQVVGISQSAVSHQLRVLKTSKLVKFRRDGKAIYYSLDDDHVRSMISLGMDHVEE